MLSIDIMQKTMMNKKGKENMHTRKKKVQKYLQNSIKSCNFAAEI